jgi:hypothetical protein
MSKLGALSPNGVDGAEPMMSAESARAPVLSPTMALALLFVRFAARLFSWLFSLATSPLYLSATGFLEASSVSGLGPINRVSIY